MGVKAQMLSAPSATIALKALENLSAFRDRGLLLSTR